MKRSGFLAYILLFFLLMVPSLSRGEEKPLVGQGEATPSWLAIGVRSDYFSLQNSRRHIVGGLIALDEDQNYAPINPLIQINLSKYLAIEAGMDWFQAMVLNGDYNYSASDCDIQWTSYMLGLQFRWPNFYKSFVPYIAGGVSYNKNTIKKNNWYYYGFPDPATYNSWISQGNKPEDWPNGGYRRIHSVDDSYGVYMGLGMDYFLTKHWAINLDWRYHWTTANWTYTLIDNGGLIRAPEPGTAVLDSWTLGLGIKYFF